MLINFCVAICTFYVYWFITLMIDIWYFLWSPLYVPNWVAVFEPKRQLSCKAHLTMEKPRQHLHQPQPFLSSPHHHFILEHKKRKLLRGACNSKALLAACRSFIKIAAATSQWRKKKAKWGGRWWHDGRQRGSGTGRRNRSASKMA